MTECQKTELRQNEAAFISNWDSLKYGWPNSKMLEFLNIRVNTASVDGKQKHQEGISKWSCMRKPIFVAVVGLTERIWFEKPVDDQPKD